MVMFAGVGAEDIVLLPCQVVEQVAATLGDEEAYMHTILSRQNSIAYDSPDVTCM